MDVIKNSFFLFNNSTCTWIYNSVPITNTNNPASFNLTHKFTIQKQFKADTFHMIFNKTFIILSVDLDLDKLLRHAEIQYKTYHINNVKVSLYNLISRLFKHLGVSLWMYQSNLFNTSLYILRTHFLCQDLKVAFNFIFDFSYYDQRIRRCFHIETHFSFSKFQNELWK